jgi:hypothetical protein
LNDLTGKLPNNLNLPYGVRQIFTPSGGRRVTDIEDLGDGENYVCAGFEGFKQIHYGKAELEPWSLGRFSIASMSVTRLPPEGVNICRTPYGKFKLLGSFPVKSFKRSLKLKYL